MNDKSDNGLGLILLAAIIIFYQFQRGQRNEEEWELKRDEATGRLTGISVHRHIKNS